MVKFFDFIDPMSEFICDEAYTILDTVDNFSLLEFAEYLERKNKLLIKEVTLRKKLNHLVERGLLNCIKGRGRTPTFYSVPKVEE